MARMNFPGSAFRFAFPVDASGTTRGDFLCHRIRRIMITFHRTGAGYAEAYPVPDRM